MQVREPSMQSSEQKQSPDPLSERSTAVSRLLPPAALSDVIGPEHCWVSAKTLAALFELDEKWLEDARVGRKEVDGPPFQKLGNGDNSPVRYNLALALDWMQRFPTVVNTAGKTFAQFQSVGDFLRLRSFTEHWLFGWHGNELLDLVELLNRDLLSDDDSVSLGWLTFPQWVFLSQSDVRFGGALQVAIDQLAGHTFARYEDRLITRIAEAPESDFIKAARDSGTI